MIHPTAIIYPGVEIEDDVFIGPYCVIGGPPEHRAFYNDEPTKGVLIKSGARIFEFVTIHAGTHQRTTIGNKVAIFNKTHIAHDCVIEREATIGGQCSLAGHTHVMSGATISGMSCTHQFTVIGSYSFIGGASFVTKHVPPGEKWVGYPARYIAQNEVGLGRAGLTYDECLKRYSDYFQDLTKR